MKHDEERRWVIPDYSKPAYYFRLFHEGRLLRPVMEYYIDPRMPRFVLQTPGMATFYKEVEKEFRSQMAKLTTAATSPVDPLDGVW